MAFKLDYGKKDDGAFERAAEEHRRRRETLVSERREKVEALLGTPDLSEWEGRFVRDMEYMATTFDDHGVLGGRLSSLSEKQSDMLERLHAQLGVSAPAP